MVICTLLQWWCLVVVAAYLVTTKTQFDVVAVRAGTGLGAVQSASRVLMAGLIPPGREAELFAFYAPGGEDVGDSRPADLWGVSRLSGGNQRLAILAVGRCSWPGSRSSLGYGPAAPHHGRSARPPTSRPRAPDPGARAPARRA